MRIYTLVEWDLESGKRTRAEWFDYNGPIAEAKGATTQQKDLLAQQQEFYSSLRKDYGTRFKDQTAILKTLNDGMSSIFSAGVGQKGFSPEEERAMRTQVTEGTAGTYAKAAKAVNAGLATRGGGQMVLGAGAEEQLRGEMATAAAGEESRQQLGITQANYATGRENFWKAGSVLGGVAQMENPEGFAGQATGAGAAAGKTASEIQQADAAASPWGIVGGILGGAASAFAGGFGSGLGGAAGKSWFGGGSGGGK